MFKRWLTVDPGPLPSSRRLVGRESAELGFEAQEGLDGLGNSAAWRGIHASNPSRPCLTSK